MSIRIILVDTHAERGEILTQTLVTEGCHVVCCVSSDSDLLAAVTDHRPDIVLIDIDSPDRDTLENLRTVQAHQPHPMVLFTQDDNGESIRKAIQAGVTAYVVDGLECRRVRPIIEAAMARFTQFRALEDELERTRTKLEEHKIIARAKGIVMEQRGVSEPDAYQAMRK